MPLVPFLDVPGAARWIRETGAERLLVELIGEVRRDFARWPQFCLVPRVASHSARGVIELMPTDDGVQYAFKYVNGHPVNPSRGLQTVTAFGVLADVETGYPVFLAEMTMLTALRTAATSALAAGMLARSDAQVHALVGTGAQAEFQALALRAHLGINSLRVHDPDPDAVAKFLRNIEPLGITVHVARDAAEAAAGADIVTTCTADKRAATILTHDMVGPGTHVNAIGGDCPGKTELAVELLTNAALYVEHTPQTRVEGELQQLPVTHPVTELWQVVAGDAPGRTSPAQVTVWDSVGFAVEDFSALRTARRMTEHTDMVCHLALVAEPEDPKDLFGLVTAPLSPSPAPA